MKAEGHELATFVKRAVQYVWCSPVVRRVFNQAGVHVLPANFYSTVPSMDEIASSFEYAGDQLPYLSPELFDRERMNAFLESLMEVSREFDPPKDGDPDHAREYFWNSNMFGFSDAMSYYCIVRTTKPRHIVEVGAGHSTLVALRAMQRNGGGSLTCVEPFPRPLLRKLHEEGAIQLVEKPAQALEPAWFNERLGDGDILFIDSTHTVKTGSDCLHLYLRVLPALRHRLMLHAHDIFLPEGYPRRWLEELNLHWTEQYLLMALLLGNDEYQVQFGSNYHKLCNLPALERLMHGRALPGGGSFWFTKTPRPPK